MSCGLYLKSDPAILIFPGTTTTAAMTAAARTPATSSASPSPFSLWVWASFSSPKLLHPPQFPQQPHPQPATLETACCPCPSAWAYAWITTPAGCTFMTLTPCDAFMRGRWIVLEPCIQRLVWWGAAKFSWRSLSLPGGWLSEEGRCGGPRRLLYRVSDKEDVIFATKCRWGQPERSGMRWLRWSEVSRGWKVMRRYQIDPLYCQSLCI